MDSLKALIVDDEDPARAELRFLLAAHPGVEVIAEASTLGQAREAVAGQRVDLVFLDVRLLGEDGFDLVPSLRAGTRVICVTGDDSHMKRAVGIDAVDYLLKPVDPAALAEAIRRLGRNETLSIHRPLAQGRDPAKQDPTRDESPDR